MSRVVLPTSTFQTAAGQEALKQVLSWFEGFKSATLPQHVWLQCQLALAEGVTNVIRHAHADLPLDTPIDVEVTLSPGRIDIRIWDHGPGFDLMDALRQRIATTNHESEGGRGLRIMDQIADDMRYEPQPDRRNCLYLSKRYSDDRAPRQPVKSERDRR